MSRRDDRDEDHEGCCERRDDDRPRLRRRRVEMVRGDTWVHAFQVISDVATGLLYTARLPNQMPPGAVPLNLTGAKVWLTVKRFASDGDGLALAQLTTTAGSVVLTTPLSGVATATMQPGPTLGFPDMDTELAYDVQVLLAGATTTVELGTLVVRPDVTSATS